MNSSRIALACALTIVYVTQLCRAQEASPSLRVTIIGVSNFEDPDLSKDTTLTASIKETADSVKQYFEKTYNIAPDLYETHDDTTADFLRTFLFRDLELDSRRVVHIIFFLTHGFGRPSGDASENKRDLFLATSDTKAPPNYVGKAIRGAELLEAFRNMSSRATVFLFLDSCGAGSIDGANFQTTLEREPELASRLLILAGSMPDESAYRARFTKALLDVWQGPAGGCHKGSDIEDFLTGEIRQIPGVSDQVQQNVRLVAPFNPDFCIESLSNGKRLLILFSGSPGDTTITLQRSDGQPIPKIPQIRNPHTVIPLSLDPDKYTLIATQKVLNSDDPSDVKTRNDVRNIDLVSNPSDVEVLFSSDPLDTDEAKSQAAALLGPQPGEAAKLRDEVESDVATQTATVEKALEATNAQSDALLRTAKDKEKEAEQDRADVDSARSRMDRVSDRVGADGSAFPPVGPDEVKNTRALVDLAEEKARKSAEEARVQRAAYVANENAKARLLKAKNRINQIRSQMASLSSNRRHIEAVGMALSQELTKSFPDLRITERGLLLALPDQNELSNSYTNKYKLVIERVKQYAPINVELEVTKAGRNTLQEQQAVRKRAAILGNLFLQLGMPAETFVYRGTIQLQNERGAGQTSKIYLVLSPK